MKLKTRWRPRWARLLPTLVLGALADPALALDAVVNFSELMYHPRGGEPEWVEIHNMMSADVDLSEWRLSGGIDYEFPDRTIIPGGGYLVIEGAGGGAGEALGP
ncbi:MAG: lamin tail domain-containing protein, partial [Akkermansiaceae bacterium]|nr:lamin tail domain-containing protein [Akkermansiaceae bacterium]